MHGRLHRRRQTVEVVAGVFGHHAITVLGVGDAGDLSQAPMIIALSDVVERAVHTADGVELHQGEVPAVIRVIGVVQLDVDHSVDLVALTDADLDGPDLGPVSRERVARIHSEVGMARVPPLEGPLDEQLLDDGDRGAHASADIHVNLP